MAYERNWQFSFSETYVTASALDNARHILWSLKAMLCGEYGGFTGAGLWSVYSSSDSVTAGNADGPAAGGSTDRWLSTYDGTKIVRGAVGANPKSWVVLKSPLMNGIYWYLIIAFESGLDTSATIWMAKGAPTSGTVNVVPTSATQWLMSTAGAVITAAAVGVTFTMNCILSETGDFVFFPVVGGAGYAALCVAAVAPIGCHVSDPYPLWTYKFYAASGAGAFLATALYGSTSANSILMASGASGTECLTSLWVPNDTSLGDNLTGKAWVLPCYVTVFTGTAWHARGRLPDISFVATNTQHMTNGSIFRNESGDIAYINLGPLVIPANAVPTCR